MEDTKLKQFSQRFLRLQGTWDLFLIAFMTNVESHSNQRFLQLNLLANSIALMAPKNSAWRAQTLSTFSGKHRRISERWSLKIPPQAAVWSVVDLSVLHFTQNGGGCFHKTSIILGAFGGCKVTSNFFKITKFDKLFEATAVERFPHRAVLDLIMFNELFQWIFLFLNLSWFLENQMEFMRLIIVTVITALH